MINLVKQKTNVWRLMLSVLMPSFSAITLHLLLLIIKSNMLSCQCWLFNWRQVENMINNKYLTLQVIFYFVFVTVTLCLRFELEKLMTNESENDNDFPEWECLRIIISAYLRVSLSHAFLQFSLQWKCKSLFAPAPPPLSSRCVAVIDHHLHRRLLTTNIGGHWHWSQHTNGHSVTCS